MKRAQAVHPGALHWQVIACGLRDLADDPPHDGPALRGALSAPAGRFDAHLRRVRSERDRSGTRTVVT